MVRTALVDAGYEISIATSGEKALQLVELELPDLILLDIIMPGMGGFETCRRLKKLDSTKGIPIIFLSALSETSEKIKGFEIGAVDFLNKPFSPEELLARVKAHISIKQLERELLNANRTLEERVAARTAELADANALLEEDIAEREQVEKELRESECRYRHVVDDQTEFICRYTKDGMVTFVNDAFCRYFGCTSEEINNHPFNLIIPDDEQNLFASSFSSLTADHPIIHFERQELMQSGKNRWQEWTNRAIFNEQGELIEYQSVGRDITDRKEMEEKLQITRFSLDKSHDMMIWFDADGNIRDTSENVARILGYSTEYLNSAKITDIDPYLTRFSWDLIWSGIKRDKLCRYESQFHTQSGEVIPVEIVLFIFFYDNRGLVLLSARDITERKQIEDLKIKAYRQIDDNIEKFSILNDQIRNPLTILLSLASELDAPLTQRMEEQIWRINNLVSQLDKGLMHSEKIRLYLRKHYGINRSEENTDKE